MMGTVPWTEVSAVIIAMKQANALMDVIGVEGRDLYWKANPMASKHHDFQYSGGPLRCVRHAEIKRFRLRCWPNR